MYLSESNCFCYAQVVEHRNKTIKLKTIWIYRSYRDKSPLVLLSSK